MYKQVFVIFNVFILRDLVQTLKPTKIAPTNEAKKANSKQMEKYRLSLLISKLYGRKKWSVTSGR